MTTTQLFVEVGTQLEETSGLLQYGLVALFAAIPIVEIFVVIPIAIGLGLDPLATGVAAFAGNTASVVLLVAFQQRLAAWWHRWRGTAADGDGAGRHARARRIWDRYGLPGLALAGPVVTGIHIAALVGLAAGSRARAVAWWTTVSLGIWTVVFVAGSVYGLSLLGIV